MTSYQIPAGCGESEIVEKRSRFLGCLQPVETEAAARAHIESVKKRHYDARHNVYAYLLRSGTQRYSDDGELQGTAGQPILAVLQGAGVTDVCCVVTRYFGGVLLGTGGLTRAYSAAAKAALDTAGLRTLAPWRRIALQCPYPFFERLQRLLAAHEGEIAHSEFGAAIALELLLREDRAAAFCAAVTERSAGAVSAQPGEALLR
ncbi:MAG: YigZ family protein [Oscillospiraceae bacterium]|nr:YigZ family protein [Oscillospiraceae bacterium]